MIKNIMIKINKKLIKLIRNQYTIIILNLN